MDADGVHVDVILFALAPKNLRQGPQSIVGLAVQVRQGEVAFLGRQVSDPSETFNKLKATQL